jgi:hypothetical protein
VGHGAAPVAIKLTHYQWPGFDKASERLREALRDVVEAGWRKSSE